MNKKEIKTQIALGTYLQTKWKEYLTLRDNAYKLYAKAERLQNKIEKKHTTRPIGPHRTIKTEIAETKVDKLNAQADQILTKAKLIWLNAVADVYEKNTIITWYEQYSRCTVCPKNSITKRYDLPKVFE